MHAEINMVTYPLVLDLGNLMEAFSHFSMPRPAEKKEANEKNGRRGIIDLLLGFLKCLRRH